jgi:hypothetical protein
MWRTVQKKSTPFRKAQKQRRIAQRRERAPRVGDDEDEEHHHMGHMLAVVVGADQRAYQQHGCPRGAHEAGQHRANGQDGRVEPRAAVQVAADVDATRHSEQRRQQNDEGQCIRPTAHAQSWAPATCGPKDDGKGQQKRQAPGPPPPCQNGGARRWGPTGAGAQSTAGCRQTAHPTAPRAAAIQDIGGSGQARQQGAGRAVQGQRVREIFMGCCLLNACSQMQAPARCAAGQTEWAGCFTGVMAGLRGNVEHLAQVGQVFFVVAHVLAWACPTAWPPAARCIGPS